MKKVDTHEFGHLIRKELERREKSYLDEKENRDLLDNLKKIKKSKKY